MIIPTATDRFKLLFLGYVTRCMHLEEQLELRDEKIAELEQKLAAGEEEKPSQ